MIQKIYAIRDIKAAHYGIPFFLPSNGIAIRSFSDLANDPKTTINKHPDDFQLFVIGEYDDNSGELVSLKPEFLSNASEFTQKK